MQQSSVKTLAHQKVVQAWQAQLARVPKLRRQLKSREQELLPRFAAQYETLSNLPRRLRRSLLRRYQQSLAGVALLLALGPAPALGITIILEAGDEAGLIQAINDANSEVVPFDGPDTIVLTKSTFTLTAVNNTTFGATGLPVIASDITIQGNGSTITRMTGAPNFRIVAVNTSGNLTLRNTTISGGLIDATKEAFDDGGGIANYGGTITLTGATVTGNSSVSTGGGVFSESGTMTLTNATVSGNSANYFGGVYNRSGTMTLTNATVSGNSADAGGGVYNRSGTMMLTNATVSGNSAANNFGGVLNVGTMTLTNSTVSGNSANNFGGVFNNGTMTLSRTLVSGNTGGASPEVFNYSNATINANDFNLFGANGSAGTNFTPGATDIVPGAGVMVANILAPLALNPPGTTRTHALVTGSPARDAVTTGCPPPAKDQRGASRPKDGNGDGTAQCDSGAYEAAAVTPPDGRCDGQVVTLMGNSGNNTLNGTNGRDVIQGLGGNDTINGRNGNDVICGGIRADTLNGEGGLDRLFGDGGNDRLTGGIGNDRLNGGANSDTCNGGSGTDSAESCEQRTSIP